MRRIKDGRVLGQRDECEALIDQYTGYVYAIVSRIAGRFAAREDIEECVADVLWALWEGKARYDPEKGSFKAYAAAIARNKAVKVRQKACRASFLPLDEDLLEVDAPDLLAALEQNELMALVNDAVQSLDPPDPEIFTRRYYWGEALSDIAQALGLSERAVEGRLYRGRRQLKNILEGRV